MILFLSSWIKVMKPAFVTYHDAVKKLSASSSILFPATARKLFADVCAPTENDELSGHKLSNIPNLPPPPGPHGALRQSLLPFPCYMAFLSDKLTYFSFISLGRGSTRTTTTGYLAMSVFLSFKGFTNPKSLLVHMQASPYAQ
jgi:hypothetical protein